MSNSVKSSVHSKEVLIYSEACGFLWLNNGYPPVRNIWPHNNINAVGHTRGRWRPEEQPSSQGSFRCDIWNLMGTRSVVMSEFLSLLAWGAELADPRKSKGPCEQRRMYHVITLEVLLSQIVCSLLLVFFLHSSRVAIWTDGRKGVSQSSFHLKH